MILQCKWYVCDEIEKKHMFIQNEEFREKQITVAEFGDSVIIVLYTTDPMEAYYKEVYNRQQHLVI
jgi:hypothetical protein